MVRNDRVPSSWGVVIGAAVRFVILFWFGWIVADVLFALDARWTQ